MMTIADPIEAGNLRLRHEFLSMPALCLTPGQVARLLDMRLECAADVLDSLERDGFLIRTPEGAFRRAQPPLG